MEPCWGGGHGEFPITGRAQTSPVGAAAVLGVPLNPQLDLRPPSTSQALLLEGVPSTA